MNLCVSALGGRVQVRSRQMKTLTSQPRNKTHLPNWNFLLEICRTNKHLRARGGTDDGHIRANAQWRITWTGSGSGRVTGSRWIGTWVGGWVEGVTIGATQDRVFHYGWEKPGKRGGVKRNKIKSDSNNLIHTGNHWLNKPQCWLQ